jgi:hypothetical protein
LSASLEAKAYGRQVADKMLRGGRKGHGGKAAITYRVMREADLIALASIAFDAGRESAR